MFLRWKRCFTFVLWPRPLLADWTANRSRALPEFVWEKVWCHSSTMWCYCKIKSGTSSSVVSTRYFSRLTNVTTWQWGLVSYMTLLCDHRRRKQGVPAPLPVWLPADKEVDSELSLLSDWLRTPWLMLRLLMVRSSLTPTREAQSNKSRHVRAGPCWRSWAASRKSKRVDRKGFSEMGGTNLQRGGALWPLTPSQKELMLRSSSERNRTQRKKTLPVRC